MKLCGELVAAGLHLASWHSDPMSNGEEYKTATTGVYVRCESGLQVGAFRNSEGEESVYGAIVYEKKYWFIAGGLATGYEGRPIAPVGGVGVKLGPLRLMYAPPAPKNGSHLLHAMWEVRF